jgi:hypothetical protein
MESVELARMAAPRSAGFVNAVLRRLARDGEPPAADPTEDPLRWLTTTGSLPPWLARRWAERLGPAAAVARAQAFLDRPPPSSGSTPGSAIPSSDLRLRVSRSGRSPSPARGKRAVPPSPAWRPTPWFMCRTRDPSSWRTWRRPRDRPRRLRGAGRQDDAPRGPRRRRDPRRGGGSLPPAAARHGSAGAALGLAQRQPHGGGRIAPALPRGFRRRAPRRPVQRPGHAGAEPGYTVEDHP